MEHKTRIVIFIFSSFFLHLADATEKSLSTNTRFTANEDTVLDEKTGLRWKRCSSGQAFKTGGKCVGKAKKLGFFAAQKSINWNKREGYWRIPTRDEIKTIAGDFSLDNKVNTSIFPDIDKNNRFYWTSDMSYDGAAWFADMLYGGVSDVSGDYEFIDRKFNIRLVHVER